MNNMNAFERFLTFAYDKVVNDDGFYYSFRDTEIEFLPTEGDLRIAITFEGVLEVTYYQYEGNQEIVEATETFSEDVKLSEIVKWVKSKIK
jgi:hypothetical protein